MKATSPDPLMVTIAISSAVTRFSDETSKAKAMQQNKTVKRLIDSSSFVKSIIILCIITHMVSRNLATLDSFEPRQATNSYSSR